MTVSSEEGECWSVKNGCRQRMTYLLVFYVNYDWYSRGYEIFYTRWVLEVQTQGSEQEADYKLWSEKRREVSQLFLLVDTCTCQKRVENFVAKFYGVVWESFEATWKINNVMRCGPTTYNGTKLEQMVTFLESRVYEGPWNKSSKWLQRC